MAGRWLETLEGFKQKDKREEKGIKKVIIKMVENKPYTDVSKILAFDIFFVSFIIFLILLKHQVT